MTDAFALENFAPSEDVRFKLKRHGDHEFVVDADPDTADIARMLRIEEAMKDAESEHDAVAAAEEGKELLLRLVQERQPDVTELKAGMQEVLIVFSLIVRGASVAEAVARSILAPPGPDASENRSNSAEDAQQELPEGEGEPAAPLASAKSSRASSSSSATAEDSLPATGTG